mmetsp:Transcript_661/g.1577  ORF Transcript_661/g.1577 Transcript_661/m.1577 type:complete len:216 (+) Transcript_661:483-1130(+)
MSLSDVSDSPAVRRANLPRARLDASWHHCRMMACEGSLRMTCSPKRSFSPPSLSLSLRPPPPPDRFLKLPPILRNFFAVRGVRSSDSCSNSHMRLCSRNFRRNASVVRSAIVNSPRPVPIVSRSVSLAFSNVWNSVGRSSSPIMPSSICSALIFHRPMISAMSRAPFLVTTHRPIMTPTTRPKRMSSNILYCARSIMESDSTKRNEPEPPRPRMK